MRCLAGAASAAAPLALADAAPAAVDADAVPATVGAAPAAALSSISAFWISSLILALHSSLWTPLPVKQRGQPGVVPKRSMCALVT